MRVTIAHKRMNGERVKLVVDVDADGAILFWHAEDPATGERVEMSSTDKWYAATSMHSAIRLMKRGAA